MGYRSYFIIKSELSFSIAIPKTLRLLATVVFQSLEPKVSKQTVDNEPVSTTMLRYRDKFTL